MTTYIPGEQIAGPIVTLAAQVKAALEASPDALIVKTEYGDFYVSKIELTYGYGVDSEVCGFLTPDEGTGETFDLYTAKGGKSA